MLPSPLAPADLMPALETLFRHRGLGRGAAQRQAESFQAYLAESGIGWEGLCAGPPSAPRGLWFALLLPGRTALIMLPHPDSGALDDGVQREVLRTGLASLAPRRLHYAQALLEPAAAGQRAWVTGSGFAHVAALEYLERDAVYPWTDPPPAAVEWVAYSADTHAAFADTVRATYRESHDCPELTGLRPIDDVLAAHRAAGRFRPAWWELARVDGAWAGVLLLAEIVRAPLLEVAYMGVVPAYRRRGIGAALLQRALVHARAAPAQRLTVVVDARNAPARRLYARFGLAPVAQRNAFLYRWPGAAGDKRGTACG